MISTTLLNVKSSLTHLKSMLLFQISVKKITKTIKYMIHAKPHRIMFIFVAGLKCIRGLYTDLICNVGFCNDMKWVITSLSRETGAWIEGIVRFENYARKNYVPLRNEHSCRKASSQNRGCKISQRSRIAAAAAEPYVAVPNFFQNGSHHVTDVTGLLSMGELPRTSTPWDMFHYYVLVFPGGNFVF
jgi:hypothetical protein